MVHTVYEIIEDGFGFVPNPSDLHHPHLVKRYTLTNSRGLQVQVINYGATVISIKVPDSKGVFEDVVLGFDNIKGFLDNQKLFFNCVIGRVANRISKAHFRLKGKDYYLPMNEEFYHANGGFRGFDQNMWESHVDSKNVVFTYLSKNMEEGYPGNLMVQVVYSLTRNDELVVNMKAMCTEPTPIDLKQNIYFNLAGHQAGEEGLMEHVLTLNSDNVLVTYPSLMPTGDKKHVGGTMFDFRMPRKFKKLFAKIPRGGYDHTFIVNLFPPELRFVARLVYPPKGRVLEIRSNKPTLHVYTGRYLPDPNQPFPDEPPEPPVEGEDDGDLHPTGSAGVVDDVAPTDSLGCLEGPPPVPPGTPINTEFEDGDVSEEEVDDIKPLKKSIAGKGGIYYKRYGGIVLATQDYPNAVNRVVFPENILYPGQMYEHTIIYHFFTKPHVPEEEPEEPHFEPELIEYEGEGEYEAEYGG